MLAGDVVQVFEGDAELGCGGVLLCWLCGDGGVDAVGVDLVGVWAGEVIERDAVGGG